MSGDFGVIDSVSVIEQDNNIMVAVEITLPDRLYRSIRVGHVLTLSSGVS